MTTFTEKELKELIYLADNFNKGHQFSKRPDNISYDLGLLLLPYYMRGKLLNDLPSVSSSELAPIIRLGIPFKFANIEQPLGITRHFLKKMFE